jgi:hypothetical protein
MPDWNQIIYKSGDFFLPPSVKRILDLSIYKSYNYSFYIEVWHIVHFITGFLLGLIFIKCGYGRNLTKYLWDLFIIHTVWEYWQVYIGMSHPLRLTYHNNLLDIIFDTFVFMSGSYLVFILV